MYNSKDTEDLNREIFDLKKQLLNANDENQLLKVKVRKLLNEVTKKNKEIEAILNSRKFSDLRNIIYERNAAFIVRLKEQNESLKSLINDKDLTIKKLQSDVKVLQLYSHSFAKLDYKSDINANKKLSPDLKCSCSHDTKPIYHETESKDISKKRNAVSINLENTNEMQTKYFELSDADQNKKEEYDADIKVAENLKMHTFYNQSSSRKSSPESDLERMELLCQSPHVEVQQLHLHFLDMISEVDHLKYTISQLESKQQKTEDVLKKKNQNVDKLRKEIKNLRKPTPKCNNSLNFTNNRQIERIYSATNTNFHKGTKHENGKKENKKERKAKCLDQQLYNTEHISKETAVILSDETIRKNMVHRDVTQMKTSKNSHTHTRKYIKGTLKNANYKDESSQTETELFSTNEVFVKCEDQFSDNN